MGIEINIKDSVIYKSDLQTMTGIKEEVLNEMLAQRPAQVINPQVYGKFGRTPADKAHDECRAAIFRAFPDGDMSFVTVRRVTPRDLDMESFAFPSDRRLTGIIDFGYGRRWPHDSYNMGEMLGMVVLGFAVGTLDRFEAIHVEARDGGGDRTWPNYLISPEGEWMTTDPTWAVRGQQFRLGVEMSKGYDPKYENGEAQAIRCMPIIDGYFVNRWNTPWRDIWLNEERGRV
jgi:hypothetical protein